jgi:hypothetical protein
MATFLASQTQAGVPVRELSALTPLINMGGNANPTKLPEIKAVQPRAEEIMGSLQQIDQAIESIQNKYDSGELTQEEYMSIRNQLDGFKTKYTAAIPQEEKGLNEYSKAMEDPYKSNMFLDKNLTPVANVDGSLMTIEQYNTGETRKPVMVNGTYNPASYVYALYKTLTDWNKPFNEMMNQAGYLKLIQKYTGDLANKGIDGLLERDITFTAFQTDAGKKWALANLYQWSSDASFTAYVFDPANYWKIRQVRRNVVSMSSFDGAYKEDYYMTDLEGHLYTVQTNLLTHAQEVTRAKAVRDDNNKIIRYEKEKNYTPDKDFENELMTMKAERVHKSIGVENYLYMDMALGQLSFEDAVKYAFYDDDDATKRIIDLYSLGSDKSDVSIVKDLLRKMFQLKDNPEGESKEMQDARIAAVKKFIEAGKDTSNLTKEEMDIINGIGMQFINTVESMKLSAKDNIVNFAGVYVGQELASNESYMYTNYQEMKSSVKDPNSKAQKDKDEEIATQQSILAGESEKVGTFNFINTVNDKTYSIGIPIYMYNIPNYRKNLISWLSGKEGSYEQWETTVRTNKENYTDIEHTNGVTTRIPNKANLAAAPVTLLDLYNAGSAIHVCFYFGNNPVALELPFNIGSPELEAAKVWKFGQGAFTPLKENGNVIYSVDGVSKPLELGYGESAKIAYENAQVVHVAMPWSTIKNTKITVKADDYTMLKQIPVIHHTKIAEKFIEAYKEIYGNLEGYTTNEDIYADFKNLGDVQNILIYLRNKKNGTIPESSSAYSFNEASSLTGSGNIPTTITSLDPEYAAKRISDPKEIDRVIMALENVIKATLESMPTYNSESGDVTLTLESYFGGEKEFRNSIGKGKNTSKEGLLGFPIFYENDHFWLPVYIQKSVNQITNEMLQYTYKQQEELYDVLSRAKTAGKTPQQPNAGAVEEVHENK